jgi:long-chain acyl-CoA synthetase
MTDREDTAPGTLPQLLMDRTRLLGDGAVALREKKYGIWQETSWASYGAHVRSVCLGLIELGVARGDTVALISGNRPSWLYVELATQSAGAIPVGIPVDDGHDEIRCALEHCEARVVFAEDQEQADKVLNERHALPRLRHVVVDDTRGLEGYGDPMLVDLAAVAQRGRELAGRDPQAYERLLASGKPSDVALLAYPPTGGGSRAAMITHRNLLAMATGITQVDPVRATDDIFSFLPFAWVTEQLISVAVALGTGAIVNFPEEPETARADLGEVAPHVLIAPPRFWESLRVECLSKLADAGLVKRATARAALAAGHAVAAGRGGRMLYGLAYLLAVRNMLDKLGLSRIRHAYADGGQLDGETLEFFRTLGLNLKPSYGRAETSGMCVLPRDGEVRAATVGTPTPGTRIRISERGEVLVASESVFVGYFKDADASARALDGGWFHTGDAGAIDEHGHLVLTRSDASRAGSAPPPPSAERQP